MQSKTRLKKQPVLSATPGIRKAATLEPTTAPRAAAASYLEKFLPLAPFPKHTHTPCANQGLAHTSLNHALTPLKVHHLQLAQLSTPETSQARPCNKELRSSNDATGSKAKTLCKKYAKTKKLANTPHTWETYKP